MTAKCSECPFMSMPPRFKLVKYTHYSLQFVLQMISNYCCIYL
uniref:Uncharacterized protein n=1 Tax=Anguilla anguilla TaxID=7936 RepID=A0A0E9RMY2_ANGAN